MATAEQFKALLRSYVAGDGDRFLTVSMQVAAHAARKGQEKLARELRELIDEAKERAVAPPTNHAVPIARLPGDLGDLIAASYPKTRMVDMVLSPRRGRACSGSSRSTASRGNSGATGSRPGANCSWSVHRARVRP